MRFLRVEGGKDNRLSSISSRRTPSPNHCTKPSVATFFFTVSSKIFFLIPFFSLGHVRQWKMEGRLQLDNAAKPHPNLPTNPQVTLSKLTIFTAALFLARNHATERGLTQRNNWSAFTLFCLITGRK